MPRLALFLLGAPRIECNGRIVEVRRRKALALLAYLAMAGERQARDKVATLFWPDYDQERSRAYLRRTLWELGEALGKGWFAGERDAVSLATYGDLWLDLAEFHRQLQAARGHAHLDGRCSDCVNLLAAATSLYRGEFLAGFTLRDSPAFDDWQLLEAETLRREAAEALAMLADLHAERGEYEAAIAVSRRWLALDQWHEPAHRVLMMLYSRMGQRAEAVRQYEKCVRVLREELGAVPDADTVALYEKIKAGAPVVTVLAGRDAVHAAAGARNGDPAASPEAGPLHALPHQAVPLVGRESEVDTVGQLLSDAHCRLLTITGAGGMGKTRLAVEAAEQNAASFADGVTFVPLASVGQADFIIPAMATALSLPIHRKEDLSAQVFGFLNRRQLLLVLDSFDQLLATPAAGEVLADLLARAPRVKLLVTSRERLNLQAEWVYPLRPLAYPEHDNQDIELYPAVRLFLQSAIRARADFALSAADVPWVVRICQLVEGMPLAVDLAARWVRVLSCEEIAGEIERKLAFLGTSARDVPERHRSLITVFDHSWQLLTDQERSLFRKLSVFQGGFTREAAEHVAGATLFELASLVDKSLIQGGPGRYELHELLRQYASTKLAEAGEVDLVRTRHLQYFLAVSDAARSGLHTPQQRSWQARMTGERSNLRGALAWALESRATETAMQLGCALLDFWVYWGSMAEGRAWLEAALERADQPAPGLAPPETDVVTRGAALATAGYLAFMLRDTRLGLARLEEGLRLLRRAQAGRELAQALNMLGMAVEHGLGDYARAQALQEEAATLYRDNGDSWGCAVALNCLAGARLGLGDIEAADCLFQESLSILEKLGDRTLLTWPLLGLGAVALRRGHNNAAERHYGRSLALSEEAGSVCEAAWSLSILGHIALRQEAYDLAAARYREAMGMVRSSSADSVTYGCLMGLGDVAHAQGRLQRAARLLGAGEALRASAGLAADPSWERWGGTTWRALGDAAFAALQAEGGAMGRDAAIAYAMAETD